MTDPEDSRPEDSSHDRSLRVAERAHLLPGVLAAGSDDPTAQAEAILAESDRRVLEPEATQAESTQTDEATAEQRTSEHSA